MRDVLGWTSSLILLLTILQQIRKQWTERSGQGVSSFLFVGQAVASLGFTVYSALLQNWVFTVTNGLMLLSAITGWALTSHFKRATARAPVPGRGEASAAERLGAGRMAS